MKVIHLSQSISCKGVRKGIDNNISGNEYFNNVDENGNSSDYIYVLGNDDAGRLREILPMTGGRWCAYRITDNQRFGKCN